MTEKDDLASAKETVKTFEKEFKAKYAKQPSSQDMKEAPKAIRHAYKTVIQAKLEKKRQKEDSAKNGDKKEKSSKGEKEQRFQSKSVPQGKETTKAEVATERAKTKKYKSMLIEERAQAADDKVAMKAQNKATKVAATTLNTAISEVILRITEVIDVTGLQQDYATLAKTTIRPQKITKDLTASVDSLLEHASRADGEASAAWERAEDVAEKLEAAEIHARQVGERLVVAQKAGSDSDAAEALARVVSLEAQLEESRELHAVANEGMGVAKDKIVLLAKERDDAKEEVSRLESELFEAVKRADDLEAQNNELKNSEKALTEAIETLNSSKMEPSPEMEKKVTELEGTIADLRNALENVKKEKDVSEEEQKALRTELENFQTSAAKDLDSASSELLSLKDEASKVRDELERLQTEKVDNEHELQESQKQVICLQEQIEESQKENCASKESASKIEELELTLKTIIAENTSLKNQSEDHEEKHLSILEEKEELTEQVSILNTALEEEKEISKLKEEEIIAECEERERAISSDYEAKETLFKEKIVSIIMKSRASRDDDEESDAMMDCEDLFQMLETEIEIWAGAMEEPVAPKSHLDKLKQNDRLVPPSPASAVPAGVMTREVASEPVPLALDDSIDLSPEEEEELLRLEEEERRQVEAEHERAKEKENRRKVEEAEKKKTEEEEAEKKRIEEEAGTKRFEEAEKKRIEEAEKKRLEEKAEKKRKEEEAEKKIIEEEAEKKIIEEEAEKKIIEEEAEKKRLEKEAEKKRLEKEAEKERLEEEAETKRIEEEAEKKRIEEEAEKKRKEEEAEKKKEEAGTKKSEDMDDKKKSYESDSELEELLAGSESDGAGSVSFSDMSDLDEPSKKPAVVESDDESSIGSISDVEISD